MARVMLLGGRMFSATEHLTARQDGYLIVQTQDLGLDALLNKRLAGTITDEDVARLLIVEAHRSDKFYNLIAGRVVEDGKKWNAKDAAANAEFFGDLSAPDDKSQLTTAFVEVLNGFFTSVAGSLAVLTNASNNDPATRSEASQTSDAENSTNTPADTDGPSAPASLPMAIATT